MRLLQLATGPDEVLDLHPNVSVVTGLSVEGRSILVDAVTLLARAEAVPGPGLLEAHGVLFDVDPALLALLDPTGDDVDPIVQAVQLPAQPISLDARELRSREDAFAVLLELISAQAEKRSAARDTLDAATVALEAAHAARAAAAAGGERRQADVDRLARRLEALADERRRVRREVEEARHALAGARSVRADVEARTVAIRDARDAAVALRSSIEAELDAQAELEAIAAAEVADDTSDREGDEVIEGVVDEDAAARARELEQLLAALVPVERMLVEEALAQMADGAPDDRAPSPEAMHLADELDRVAAELASGGDGDDDAEGSLDDARERLDRARPALVEAEQAVRSPELDRDDILKLEDIHGELIEAIDRTEGRFGRARAVNRVAELRSAEQAVLDRLGFTSYSAYMMGYSLNDTDPAKEAALDRAREELSAAEDAWARLERASEPTRQRAVAIDRQRALLQHAAELLGGDVPDPPQDALRALRVDPLPRSEAAPVLAAALDAVGVDLGDEELEPDELVMMAEAWLAEAEHVECVRRAAVDELADVRAGRWSPPTPAAVLTDPIDLPADGDLADPPPIDEDPRDALARDLATAREMEQSAVATAVAADEEVAAVGAEVIELEVQVAALEDELERVDLDVAAAEEALGGLSADADLPDLDVQLEAAKAVHVEALAAMDVVDQAMATLDAEGRAEAAEIERLQDLVADQGTGTATPAEELEWYLLARLAAQRSVSIAGSAPLLLDDALRGLGIDEVCHLLTRLERMADVVQVIVLSEDPVVASWAVTTGIARAAVVAPIPASAAL